MARVMKDSGIEWIGEIPETWSVHTAFQLFSQVKNKNEGMQEDNLLSLSYGKIIKKNINATEGLLPESFEGYNIIEPEDIVLRLTDLQNDHTSLRVGISEQRGIITSAYLTLRNESDCFERYLYYQLHAFDICKGFYGMGAGVRQGLNWDGIKMLKLVRPSVTEQHRIADFLDRKCAEIDAVIEKTKATIEEYKKLKQSVITEAVTKGIRGNRLMKNSGIEWIGEIPSHWSAYAIKYIMQESKARTMTGTETMLSVTQKAGIVKSEETSIANPSISTEDWRIVKEGDIVFNKYKAHSGVFFVSPLDGIVTFNYSVYKCISGHLAKYYEYLFKTPRCIGEFITYMRGVGDSISPLYTTELYKIKAIVPPLEEQEEIVAHLDKKCAALDTLIAKKTALLTELETYKKSLIYEYVTGKKEV